MNKSTALLRLRVLVTKGRPISGMIPQRFWKVAGVILLGFGLLLFCSFQSHTLAMDLGAAASKAAVGNAARSHGVGRPVGTFITFDVPGAAKGTTPAGINPGGVVTGSYQDASFAVHGFLRSRSGTFTTFDAPGDANGTFPSAINPAGAITGSYLDTNFVGHGFLRDNNGALVTFDAPGAVSAMIGTFPIGINASNAITGVYFDANFLAHGFLRDTDGTLTTFDDPNAGTTIFPEGTTPEIISADGSITGFYGDASKVTHGFQRARDGTFTTFDPPGEISFAFLFSGPPPPTLSTDPKGVITGAYFEKIAGNPFGGNFRVFVRAPDGKYTTFDAATYPPCCIWSYPSGINPAGTITGAFNDGFSINHGFVRARDGSVTTFDAPGAGTGHSQGTVPLGINPASEIAGYYTDAKGINHGFLLIP